ncbi:hypothetical protein JHK82_017361 [Glycine max]|uniref:Uncharacterized protein n=1 Tax=Glycine soja TaxID=3848 RepID=A0A445JRK9_GLYSO|nr:hypothetical protein JHK87_017308 [Glycine soja]KAG5021460.1 hypothetical protein JHK85_017802 [Glycine max]KAG5141666.1 hypothetical protein JHK82_017361 [Glycine max]RZC01051.1 hypothetical protein D0Y65_016702 [Glycine soja]
MCSLDTAAHLSLAGAHARTQINLTRACLSPFSLHPSFHSPNCKFNFSLSQLIMRLKIMCDFSNVAYVFVFAICCMC